MQTHNVMTECLTRTSVLRHGFVNTVRDFFLSSTSSRLSSPPPTRGRIQEGVESGAAVAACPPCLSPSRAFPLQGGRRGKDGRNYSGQYCGFVAVTTLLLLGPAVLRQREVCGTDSQGHERDAGGGGDRHAEFLLGGE